mmetsp:Transcript_8219/g.19692  ORF Transcript_8219/g.19692 Transcript_8219/m.19692 type:complete len:251 (+) Transcript_8219:939-1691(+)
MANKDPRFVFMLPIPTCKEALQRRFLQSRSAARDLGVLLETIDSEAAVTYSAIWREDWHDPPGAGSILRQLSGRQGQIGRRFRGKVFLVGLRSKWRDEVLPWARRALLIPDSSLQNWTAMRARVVSSVVRLVQRPERFPERSMFLLDVGALGPILVHSMFRANPGHFYLDIRGALRDQRGEHGSAEEAGLPRPGNRRECTWTAYSRRKGCLTALVDGTRSIGCTVASSMQRARVPEDDAADYDGEEGEDP